MKNLLMNPFQAYHSQYNSGDNRLLGNLALLPVRTQYKGPAPKSSEFVHMSSRRFSWFVFISPELWKPTLQTVQELYFALGGRGVLLLIRNSYASLFSLILSLRSLSADEQDIIDESLYYFKANVFFKSYEVKVLFRLSQQGLHSSLETYFISHFDL